MSKPIRILLVERDPEMLAIYLENFSTPEFEITTAPTAGRALQILRRTNAKFDVVLTDHYMPDMSGMSLLKKIRHGNPDIRVLLITAYSNCTDHPVSNNKTMRFIDKPVIMADLKRMIENLTA